MSTLDPYGNYRGWGSGFSGVGPRGPPGEAGASVDSLSTTNLTPTVVLMTIGLTNGDDFSSTFGIEIPTGATGTNWYVDNLTVSGICDLTDANVTVTTINGGTYDTLVSTVNSDNYTLTTSINQPVKSTSDVTFNSVNVTTNVDCDEVNCNVLNAGTINYEYAQDLLVIDKKVYVAIIPTSPTGSWTGTDSNANGGGFVVQGSNEKSLIYTSATNSMGFNNVSYVGIDGVRLYDSDSIPADFSSGGFNVAGFGEIPQSCVQYIGDGSGYCSYLSKRTGGTTTNLYCFQDNGLFTINGGRIGISNTTEFDPDYQLEIRDSSNSQIRLSTNSAAQQGNMWVNSSGLQFNTTSAHPISLYTNSSATPTVYLDTDQRMAINTTSPNSTAVLHVNAGSREVRVESTTNDSIVRLTNTVSGTTNATTIKQRSGATDRELQFYNQSTSLSGATDVIYSFLKASDGSEMIRMKNNSTNYINQFVGIGPTNFTPSTALEMRGAGPSIYLNGTSAGNCGIIIKTSGAASNSQFYCDSTGVSYLSNFSADKPFVIQTSPSGSAGNAFRVEANSRRDVLVGLNSYPSAPGSYSYANGSLAVAGDMWLGNASNSYRSLIMGGGNSSGALFGNYSVQGDGLNLSYNFLVDSTNTPRYPNIGAGSSNLIMSFEQIKFQTGGISTLPTTKMYISGSRVAIGKGDNQADAALEVKTVSTEDILRLTNSSSINYWRFINDGTLGNYNPSGVLGFYLEQAGTSKEYTNILMNGYLYIYPHVQVGSTTPLVAIPADSGESMRLNGINLHVGSSSNTDSGIEFQVTGDSKLTKGIIINSSQDSAGDVDILDDAGDHLIFCDASRGNVGIGTNNPNSSYMLDINGIAVATSWCSANPNFAPTSSTDQPGSVLGEIRMGSDGVNVYMYTWASTVAFPSGRWFRVLMSMF